MSHQSRFSPWPQHPNVPSLPRNGRGTSKSSSVTEPLPMTPEITISTCRSLRNSSTTVPLQHLPSTTSATKRSRQVPNGEASRRNLPLRPRRHRLRYFLGRQARSNLSSNAQQAQYADETQKITSAATPENQPSRGLGIVNGPTTQPLVTSIPLNSEEYKGPSSPAKQLEAKHPVRKSLRNLAKVWLLEIICCILSALCMAAIIGVLIFLRNQGLPKWPLGLTLNAYIAIFSKIAGAALLVPTVESLGQLKWNWFQKGPKKILDFEIFDSASRGPWGSFLLLLRTKGRSLAALGAVISILALAIDPFFQQVVAFPERWISLGWESSVPIIRSYNGATKVNVYVEGVETSLQDSLIKSVTDSFFVSNGTQPIPFKGATKPEIPIFCPTSNCTWAEHETLSVCSACTDISDMVAFGCLSTRVDWIRNLTGVDLESTYPDGTQCGYFLNITSELPILISGYLTESINSEAGTAEAGEALLMRALPFTHNPSKLPFYGDGSINFKHIKHKIHDGIIASIPDGLVQNVYQNKTPIVQECMLAWCVKRFHSSYYLGTYEEHVTDTYLNETGVPGSFPYLFDSDGNVTDFDGDVVVRTPSGNGSSIYVVSILAATRTINIFSDLFPSFYTAQNASDEPYFRFQTNAVAAKWRTIEFNPWLSPNNVTRHLERLSVAITNALRKSNSNELFLGQALVLEAYVAVRWEWLALPIGLLMCSFIFLAATVYVSSSRRTIWKTSAIAALIYNLPDEAQKKIGSPTQTGTPRSRAMEVMVELQSKDGGASGRGLSPAVLKKHRNWPPPGWI